MYEMIFKRKSFHRFKDYDEIITEQEIEDIKQKYLEFDKLYSDIKTSFKVSRNTNYRNEDIAIFLYSEKRENYLLNVGYLLEQLDLYLVSLNIGTLWYGIGKTAEKDFVIMLLARKQDEKDFRKDMFKAKRKTVNEIADFNAEYLNILRFAPSACNLQPWYISKKDDGLLVYRYYDSNRRGIMPKDKVVYYNRIDMGIFLQYLEIILKKENIGFQRILFIDDDDSAEYVLCAKYKIFL